MNYLKRFNESSGKSFKDTYLKYPEYPVMISKKHIVGLTTNPILVLLVILA